MSKPINIILPDNWRPTYPRERVPPRPGSSPPPTKVTSQPQPRQPGKIKLSQLRAVTEALRAARAVRASAPSPQVQNEAQKIAQNLMAMRNLKQRGLY